MHDDFHGQLISLLPKLRVQALALTRNRAAAEDLVQDAVANALAAQDSFTPGTNFAAWMHRILRNRFISTLRKQRETTDIEDLPASAFAVSAAHEDRMVLKELGRALNRLPSDQREALFMVVLQGLSYEDVAAATGCAVGTAKSRVFRARRQLQAWLMGEEKEVARIPAQPEARPTPGAAHGTSPLARIAMALGNQRASA
jgi:RNA polymerase sigma-70 factor (ECF subfamily)